MVTNLSNAIVLLIGHYSTDCYINETDCTLLNQSYMFIAEAAVIGLQRRCMFTQKNMFPRMRVVEYRRMSDAIGWNEVRCLSHPLANRNSNRDAWKCISYRKKHGYCVVVSAYSAYGYFMAAMHAHYLSHYHNGLDGVSTTRLRL